MERHAGILAILCTLWGALAMVVGVSLLLLSAGALAILFGPDGSTVGLAAGVTATAFAVMGAVALVWGGAHVGASVLLRSRQPAGRDARPVRRRPAGPAVWNRAWRVCAVDPADE